MKLKTLVIGLLALAMPLIAACTPAQIAAFKAAPHDKQVELIEAIQRHKETERSKQASDCYSAARKYFPQSQWSKAYQIINRESGGNPSAKNARSTASGCFQILRGSWKHPTVSFYSGRFNPDANAKAASIIWRHGGWYCTCTWALTA